MKLIFMVLGQFGVNMLELDEKNFKTEVSHGTGLVFVDYWRQACAPCKQLAPVLTKLSEEYKDKVVFAKFDTDNVDAFPIFEQERVSALPTLILYKNGVEVSRFIGLKTEDFIKSFLNEHLF